MKTKMRSLVTLSGLISILLMTLQLTGCATAGKNTLPRGGDMTMASIYQKETGLSMTDDSANYDIGRSPLYKAREQIEKSGLRGSERVNYASYSVPSSHATKQLFKTLPNPQIPIYIYPHLVHANGEAQPVPGYTTGFFLYKENHFAMPSEVY